MTARATPGLTAVFAALLAGACTDSEIASVECGGTLFQIADELYCVYRPAQITADTVCPDLAPAHVTIEDGSLVCAARDLTPCELPEEICQVLGDCCSATPDAGVPDLDATSAMDLGTMDLGTMDLGAMPPPDDAAPADVGPLPDDLGPPPADGSTSLDSGPRLDAAACDVLVTFSGAGVVDDTELLGGSCHTTAEQEGNRSSEPTFASSADPRLSSCYVHALLRVNLASIPTGATVVRAMLRLYLEEECSSTDATAPCGSYDGRWSVPFAQLLRAWEPTQASWLEAADGMPWGEGGATGDRAAGTERDLIIDSTEGVDRYVELDALAQVRAFVLRPDDNHGWLLRSNRASGVRYARFASTEAAIAEHRPLLEVTYRPADCP